MLCRALFGDFGHGSHLVQFYEIPVPGTIWSLAGIQLNNIEILCGARHYLVLGSYVIKLY